MRPKCLVTDDPKTRVQPLVAVASELRGLPFRYSLFLFLGEMRISPASAYWHFANRSAGGGLNKNHAVAADQLRCARWRLNRNVGNDQRRSVFQYGRSGFGKYFATRQESSVTGHPNRVRTGIRANGAIQGIPAP
jgi:hypothetical protein